MMKSDDFSSGSAATGGVVSGVWLMVRLAFRVLTTRVALHTLPLPTTVRVVTPRRPRRGANRDQQAMENELRLAQWMTNLLADRNCLVRALVGLRTLRRHGYDAQLRFGVRKVGNELEAHAWLESEDGLPLDEAATPGGYVPLPPIVQGDGNIEAGAPARRPRRTPCDPSI
jgi:hypothetical protein